MDNKNQSKQETAPATNAAERKLPPLSEVPLFTVVAPIIGTMRVNGLMEWHKEELDPAYVVALGASAAVIFAEEDYSMAEKRAIIDYLWQNRHSTELHGNVTEVLLTLDDCNTDEELMWLATYRTYLKEAKAAAKNG